MATNLHVIADSSSNRVYDEIFLSLAEDGVPSSERYRLRPVLMNRDVDLALLRVEMGPDGKAPPPSFVFPSIEMGDSEGVNLLDDVVIIGYPEKGGLTVTVNRGVIEGKDRTRHWIKTDARLIQGNSGGAAVDSNGKLIGIPTKVVTDTQRIVRGGSLPDESRTLGAVGFLRPAYLIAAMIEQLMPEEQLPEQEPPSAPKITAGEMSGLTVEGSITSAIDGRPVAGAVVGLIPAGSDEVTESNLLTWAHANSEGRFVFNRPVPSGRYELRVRAIGYEPFIGPVEINEGSKRLEIRLSPGSS